ncbi:hypothetical protein [Nocardia sp. GAS34]|uniref:hypothetical protein n=1 Tax=unclassified Nocardia TaxID=2637762 RepID=UPI003D20C240
MGRFEPGRWRVHGSPVAELFIAAEGFVTEPHYVLGTMLHHAAHAIACEREVIDASRAGAYHNSHFRSIAEQLGLTVTRHRTQGWSETTVPAHTRSAYSAQLAQLAAEIGPHRRIQLAPATVTETGTPRATRNGRSLTCACTPPRRLRASDRSIAGGPTLCGLCGREFLNDH